ncbi:MAG: hypothetical protein Q8P68_03110 [Candidatus Peregrinibacteria bacterium]|nr:hypothetical protein [Candidatus Peregrinibacteria bacterium]MDZ4244686.1 hypothetical protein [Candidatus Gracilibacteria bacterium]
MASKKNVKMLIFLLVLSLAVVIAFGAFSSEDGQGRARRIASKSSTQSTTVTQNVAPSPAVTIQSYGNLNTMSNIRLDYNNTLCNESSYARLGQWKINSNTPITARGFSFWNHFGTFMTDYRVIVSRESEVINYITSYNVTSVQNYFNALKPNNVTFTIPANQPTFITLYGKYKATSQQNRAITAEVAITNNGVIGSFNGLVGSPINMSGFVQNNQTNFTAGFTEINSANGATCNRFE